MLLDVIGCSSMSLPVDSLTIIKTALGIYRRCEECNVVVPSLSDLLKTAIACKTCDGMKVIKMAAPGISQRVEQILAAPTYATKIQSSSIEALKILAIAKLSTNAKEAGNYNQFCDKFGLTATPLSQAMYFTLGKANENALQLWCSPTMRSALNMNASEIQSKWIEPIKAFARETNPEILAENQAKLLSGIEFDFNQLDEKLLEEADFPCRRIQGPKVHRQQLLAALGHDILNITDKMQRVNPAIITEEDLRIIEEVKKFKQEARTIREVGKLVTPRDEIKANREKLVPIIQKVSHEKNILTESQLCSLERDRLFNLKSEYDSAKRNVNWTNLHAANLSYASKFELPDLTGKTRYELSQIKATLSGHTAILKQYKK